MAQTSAHTVRVEGLRELQQSLKTLRDKELDKRVRAANKAAAEVVKPEAVRASPDGKRDPKSSKKYRPGKLDRSVTVQATSRGAVLKAGSASRVPYAAAIHFGYPKRNIKRNAFLFRAMARKSGDVGRVYEEQINSVMREYLET